MNTRHPDWATVYNLPEAELPWHFEELDPDLAAALLKLGLNSGAFLDIGCGTGTQAERLAEAGFEVMGLDISESAIGKAKLRNQPNLRFQIFDLARTPFPERFKAAFDRGCFHVLPEIQRRAFVRNVHQSLKENGFLFVKCFSTEEPDRGFGPLRFSPDDIAREFGDYFSVVSCGPAVFQGTKPHKPKSLFVTLARKSIFSPN